jgi:hypothetical protein
MLMMIAMLTHNRGFRHWRRTGASKGERSAGREISRVKESHGAGAERLAGGGVGDHAMVPHSPPLKGGAKRGVDPDLINPAAAEYGGERARLDRIRGASSHHPAAATSDPRKGEGRHCERCAGRRALCGLRDEPYATSDKRP